MNKKPLLGGLEGGGTKFACAVGTGSEDILDEVRFPTTSPEETIERALAFFKRYKPEAIGLASFGPLDLSLSSPSYGCITATPKPGWANTDILGKFRNFFDIPLAFDTDVNAAAYGEFKAVQQESVSSLVYFTIGTGIGAGVIVNGKIVHGLTHPETGHMRIPHDRIADPFHGTCPFHGDCFEGLASGPAITSRWGCSGESLPEDHPAWDLEADYLSLAIVNMIYALSPEQIVLGGGVMQRAHLFPLVRRKVLDLLNYYIPSPIFSQDLTEFIISPRLGTHSGILGAMAMAGSLLSKP